MDTLNLSCRIKSKRDSGKFCTPVYSLAKSAFKRVIKSDGAQQWLKQHRYVRSGLVWLYAHDLRLTPPNWIWLKGVDRTLFYALHRANTTKGFIEGAGVVAVARAEAEAMRFGLPALPPVLMKRWKAYGGICSVSVLSGMNHNQIATGNAAF